MIRPGDMGSWRAVALLSSAGLTLALSVAIGAGIGYLLDRWLKTSWLVILFTLLGVAAGFKELIRAVLTAEREQQAADRKAAGVEQTDRDSGDRAGQ